VTPRLSIIDETRQGDGTFAPFVPAMSESGTVAYVHRREDGHSEIRIKDPARRDGSCVLEAPDEYEFVSHPDLNAAGAVAVYARHESGTTRLLLCDRRGWHCTERAREPLSGLGPTGPSMNEEGAVAWRATEGEGRAHIGLWTDSGVRVVARDDEDRFASFEGVPMVSGDGSVLFRAVGKQGEAIIARAHPSRPALEVVAQTGDDWSDLSRFPSLSQSGLIAFGATRRSGEPELCFARCGELLTRVGLSPFFASIRGAALPGRGTLFFWATPPGGALGIYRLAQASSDVPAESLRDRFSLVLGVGEPLVPMASGGRSQGASPGEGSTVREFALNPVSVNERGAMAVRLATTDGREFIGRIDA